MRDLGRAVESRDLGSLEELYLLLDQVGGTNFVGIATFGSNLDEEWLKKAFLSAQNRHWILSVRVDLDRSSRRILTTADVPSIPLNVAAAPRTQVFSYAESELRTPLNSRVGPLIRCTLLKHPNSTSSLLLTLSHAIADGLSGVRILREVLEGVKDPDQSEFSPGPVIENYIPVSSKGWKGFGKLLYSLPRKLRERSNVGDIGEESKTTKEILTGREPHILPLEFNQDFTLRLHWMAKQNHTTFYSALCAAQIMALASTLRGTAMAKIAISSGVDLRRRLPRSVAGNYLGLLSSALLTHHQISPITQFWDLARQVRKCIGKEIRDGEPFKSLNTLDMVMKILRLLNVQSESAAIRLAKLGRRLMPFHSPITYAGKIEVTPPTSLSIRSLCGAFTGPPDWCIGSAANEFDNRLFWNFVYITPEIDALHAEAIAQHAREMLRQSIQ